MTSESPASRIQEGDDAGFQPERTGLAWNRTLVVLAVAIGMLGVHAYRDGLHVGLTVIAAFLAAIVLVLSSPFARARSHHARDLLTGSVRIASPMPLLVLAIVTGALALASLILITVRG